MKILKTQQTSTLQTDFFKFGNLILPAVSLVSLGLTFLVAISNIGFEKKITIFLATIIFYILFFVFLNFWQKNNAVSEKSEIDAEAIFDAEVEKQLLALDDASRFFGASLKTADMFRLALSRVQEIVPHSASSLVLVDKFETDLKIISAGGLNSREFLRVERISRKGLAGISLNLRKIKIDEKLTLEKNVLSYEALKDFESAVAVPFFEAGEKVFAVLTLYGNRSEKFTEDKVKILEAMSNRIAPLILNSLAVERNHSNALTDALTSLPNERAFYLILENHIAESQRKREERPLSVLSIDIKEFSELNQKYGHSTGDKILAFVADNIKHELRKMDFLARSGSDEFLAVLPTANEDETHEIVARIDNIFQITPFEIASGEKSYLKMNIGAASFIKNGESAPELLQTARLKKETTKMGHEAKVIWFPKEFVN